MTGSRYRRRRWSFEGAVQVTIMLAIGTAAGGASFTHVHDVAAAHGQDGWLAWADAVVLELMSVAAGLEIRRRKKLGARLAFPVAVLVVAVFLSLAAQVVEAEQSPIGWTAAAIPALGFLVMVKIALAQSPARPAALDSALTDESPSIVQPGRPEPDPVVAALVPAARSAALALQAGGHRVTRSALADALRAEGYGVSNSRASALLRELGADPELQLSSTGLPGVLSSRRRARVVAMSGKS